MGVFAWQTFSVYLTFEEKKQQPFDAIKYKNIIIITYWLICGNVQVIAWLAISKM